MILSHIEVGSKLLITLCHCQWELSYWSVQVHLSGTCLFVVLVKISIVQQHIYFNFVLLNKIMYDNTRKRYTLGNKKISF